MEQDFVSQSRSILFDGTNPYWPMTCGRGFSEREMRTHVDDLMKHVYSTGVCGGWEEREKQFCVITSLGSKQR